MPPVHTPKVLVTGASGFLAAHVCNTLLERGYRVVGTVRSQNKGEYLEKLYNTPNFSFAVVPDISAKGAIDSLLSDIDCVQHTASQFHFGAHDPDELIRPAVEGTLSVLNSVLEHGTNVKRVVYTSSTAAVITPRDKPTNFTEDDWNTHSPAEVERLGVDAGPSDKYQASKVISERAAWEFVANAERKANGSLPWDLVTICPPFIFGPIIHEVSSPDKLNTSSAFFNGWISELPPKEQVISPFLNLVDVRDVALAHVLAMKNPNSGGERFIVSNGPFCVQDIYDALSDANVPDVPRGYPGEQTPQAEQHAHDGSKACKVLGLEMTSRSKMCADTVESLRKLTRRENGVQA
ncbi:putative D-lactaldehyde dehydrogenase [Clavulina sp. PMI_390]|nr:putative D-lactaldehyde dehydrogenase [Clavulina sp. PMI_390]